MSDVPHSPIVGRDGRAARVGQTEYRRARLNVEIVYACQPGEHVDIQALVFDAVLEAGGNSSRDLGPLLTTVDLTEHVTLDALPRLSAELETESTE